MERKRITVKVTDSELAGIRQAADAFDMTLSEFIRSAAQMKARYKGIHIPDEMPAQGDITRIPEDKLHRWTEPPPKF